jgi:integrase
LKAKKMSVALLAPVPEEHLFSGQATLSESGIRLAFEHLRVRAGMDDFRFHDLRHEGVSRLFEKGLNIAEVSTISGHKELRMLQRYTHLRAEDLVSRLD